MNYYYKHINEGFNILPNRTLVFTDEHEDILNTSLSGEPTIFNLYSEDLKKKIAVYSLFKRCKRENKKGDSNPVLYALKNEKYWSFKDVNNKIEFWNRFKYLLNKFLQNHKNKFNTVIIIPSSNKLNKNIQSEIEKIAKEVGITHISSGGLHTIFTDNLLDSAFKENSYFRKYWGDDFNIRYEQLEQYAQIMYLKNNDKFKYHLIDDQELRKSIIHTLEIDKDFAFLYKPFINNKDILIVDDSITHGQSINNAIHAIKDMYIPKSISVLTMFSKLYDENGNEI